MWLCYNEVWVYYLMKRCMFMDIVKIKFVIFRSYSNKPANSYSRPWGSYFWNITVRHAAQTLYFNKQFLRLINSPRTYGDASLPIGNVTNQWTSLSSGLLPYETASWPCSLHFRFPLLPRAVLYRCETTKRSGIGTVKACHIKRRLATLPPGEWCSLNCGSSQRRYVTCSFWRSPACCW